MLYLVLGLAVLIALGLVGRWFLNADPKTAATAVRWVALGGGALLGLFLLMRVGTAVLFPIVLTTLFLRRPRLCRIWREDDTLARPNLGGRNRDVAHVAGP